MWKKATEGAEMSVGTQVVVITGASSGIGRATAIRFARDGARVVLASRADAALEEAAAECVDAGGEALAVATDVTSQADVARLATTALEQFGRIDVWINNAGIGLFSTFEDAPLEDFRQVLEVNLFGVVHGC